MASEDVRALGFWAAMNIFENYTGHVRDGRRFVPRMLLLAVVLSGGAAAGSPRDEVQMPADSFKKLDTYEANEISKADRSFNAGNYRQSLKEYEAFIVEFPRSAAVPYVVLRKGRSLHLDGKRYEAIKQYNEIMDYFPNEVAYAAPALYYMGIAYWDSSDNEDARKAWAEMAEDKDYRTHSLAADAINRLASYLAEKEQHDQALKYFRQIAVDFRHRNPPAAQQAIDRVTAYYMRRNNEPELQQFYRDVGTFGRYQPVPADLVEDRDYWLTVTDLVKRHGVFADEQKDLQQAYYRYWVTRLGERLAGDDDFRIAVIGFHLACEGDTTKWIERLDKQFASKGKADDWIRVLKWMDVLSAHKHKVVEYYAKLDLAKMTYPQLRTLIEILYDRVKEPVMGRAVLDRVKLSQVEDKDIASLARYFWLRQPDQVEPLCGAIRDRDFGAMELLVFFAKTGNVPRALEVADKLLGSPTYAEGALWIKADLLFGERRFQDAMLCYRQSTRQPANLWRIADCLAKLGKLDEAVGQLREIETWFKQPAAALQVARLYQQGNLAKQYEAELRSVMKKYPESRESSQAHQELEGLGVRIGGGIDAN